MKILVPTDFSIYAEFALDAAIQLAKKNNGEIHLYHSANIPDDWEDLPAPTRYNDTKNKAYALMVRDKLEQFEAEVKSEGIDCFHHYTGGVFVKNITEITSKIDFDLIVMGSHGVSGKEEWFIGSNTQKIVRKLHKNILVVKNKLNHINFKKAAFITGLDKRDQEAFRHFLDFATVFNINDIHVMTVNTGSFFSQPNVLVQEVMKDFKAIAAGFSVSTHFYKDYFIEAGVRHFSEDHNIDLVAISNKVRHPLKRILQGSNVEMVVNHSEIPVLTIDYADVPKERTTQISKTKKTVQS